MTSNVRISHEIIIYSKKVMLLNTNIYFFKVNVQFLLKINFKNSILFPNAISFKFRTLEKICLALCCCIIYKNTKLIDIL